MGEVERGLLDTSVLIAREEEREAGLKIELPREISISVVTLAELHYGVLIAKDDFTRQRRLSRLGEIEASFQPLPVDSAVARAFGVVSHAVKAFGRQPRARTMDLLIAATALAHSMPVYTRNVDDFVGLRDLIEVRVV
jgi:predicted nucleic acid-binding protein